MAPPKGLPATKASTSPEIASPSPSPEDKKKKPEETKETAAEKERAGRIETGVESKRGRTELRLETLGNLIKTRNYDKETPLTINGLKPGESAEKQKPGRDSLFDVSVSMLTTIIYYGYAQNLNLDNFQNIGQLSEALARTNPRAAENAAFNKLKEFAAYMAAHPSTAEPHDETAAEATATEWRRIVSVARDMSNRVAQVATFNAQEKLEPEDKWTTKGFIHWARKEHPYAFAATAIAGAVAAFFAIRGVYRHFTKDDASTGVASASQGEKPAEKPKGARGWLKWVLGGGIALFLFGKIFGFEKTWEWLKKQGGNIQDGWAKFTGKSPEFIKNSELYTRMANRIGKEMGTPIEGNFLADLSTTKYKEIVEDDGWAKKMLDPALDAVTDNTFAKYLPGVYTKEQRKQIKVIRSYLKGAERQRIISQIAISDETTLGEVLVKMDVAMNAKEGVATGQPGKEKAPIAAEAVEGTMLPFLETNYGKVPAEFYRKVSALSYRDMMAQGSNRSLAQLLLIKARGTGAELGISKAPTEEEQQIARAEGIIRRFLQENQAIIATLSLSAGATVGDVIAEMVRSGKEFKKNEIPAGVAAMTDDDVEGTSGRDAEAKKLSAERYGIYTSQRKMIAKMLADGHYVRSGDTILLGAAAKKVAEKIRDEAVQEPKKAARERKQQLASSIDEKAKQLNTAQGERETAWNEYKAAIAANTPAEELHRTFLQAVEANGEVEKSYATLEGILSQENKWRSIAGLAGLQLPRAAYVYFSQPFSYRGFIRNYYGSFGIPTEMTRRIGEGLKRTPQGLALAQRRVEEGEARLRGTLGENLEGRANLTASDSSARREAERPAYRRYKVENALFEHDKKLLAAEKALDELKRNVSPDATALKTLEKEVADLKFGRIKLSSEAIAEASEDFYIRVKEVKGRALTAEQWKELDDLAARGASHNRDIMRAGEDIMQQIKAAGKRGAPRAEIEALQESFNETVKGIGKMQKSLIQRLADVIETRMGRFGGKYVAKAVRAPGAVVDMIAERRSIKTAASSAEAGLTEGEQKHFRKVLAMILHWQKSTGTAAKTAKESTPLLRVAKGKLAFYGLALGVGAAIGVATKDEQVSYKGAIGQAALDMAPLTGTASDFLTMIYGREMISGRKVTGLERWFMRPAFGVVGAASDILLIAGIGVGARASLGALRGSVEASRLIRLKGAIQLAAKTATKEIAGHGAARAAGTVAAEEGTEAVTRAGAAERSQIMEALRYLGRHRTAASFSIAGAGIGVPLVMNLVKQDEMEIPPSIEAVAGGPDGKIDDISLEQLATPEAPGESGSQVAAAA